MSFFGELFKKPKTDAVFDVKSPNGRIIVNIILDRGQIFYNVRKDEKALVRKSRLGIMLKDTSPLADGFCLVRAYSRALDDTWRAQWGEQHVIRNNYNETAVYLEEVEKPSRLMTIRFRVYDDGFAFRYEIPAQPEMERMIISDELTEFAVDPNGTSWSIPAYQPDRYEYDYIEHPVSSLTESVHTPLTIQTPAGTFLSIHEAALYNYGGMTLKMNNSALRADITPLSDGMRAYVELPFSTPWRMVIVGENELDLTTSRMMLNLNDPPREDFSWVEPKKF